MAANGLTLVACQELITFDRTAREAGASDRTAGDRISLTDASASRERGRELGAPPDAAVCPCAAARVRCAPLTLATRCCTDRYPGPEEAINAASDGDCVLVGSGSYGAVGLIQKRLTIRGVRTDGTRPIINAVGGTPGFQIGASSISIVGFELQGDFQVAGAIMNGGSAKTIDSILIQDNNIHPTSNNGVYFNFGAPATAALSNLSIQGNRISTAGNMAIYIGGTAKGTSLTAHSNCLSGTAVLVWVDDTALLDAAGNYWGASTCPGNSSFGPSTKVDVFPCLAACPVAP